MSRLGSRLRVWLRGRGGVSLPTPAPAPTSPDSILDDMMVLRDARGAAGEAPIQLADLIAPGFGTPAGWSVVSGLDAGHLALTGDQLDVTPAGIAAGMADETYTIVVQADFGNLLPAAYRYHRATVTAVYPAQSRYVDPAAGDDANDGLTRTTAWRSIPGQTGATGAANAYAPAQKTLVVVKGGSLMRASVAVRANLYYTSGDQVGWGAGAAELRGSTPLGTAAQVTPAEVAGNPLSPFIRKYAIAAPHNRAQYLIDGPRLVLPAQWPAAGADQLLDSADPQRHLTGGMYRYPSSSCTGFGTTSTVITGTAAAAIRAEFGDISLVGYTIWHWADQNDMVPFTITAHDLPTGQITFSSSGHAINAPSGVTAFQIVGHPWSIKGPNQFAAFPGATTVFAYLVDGSAPEILSLRYGFKADNIRPWALQGFLLQGYFNTTSGSEGCAVSVYMSPVTTTAYILRNEMKFIVNDSTKSGAVMNSSGKTTGVRYDRNWLHDMVRASGIRHANSDNRQTTVIRNRIGRVGRTGFYIANSSDALIRANYFYDMNSAHGNGLSPYRTGSAKTLRLTIEFNTTVNVSRPLTQQICFDSVTRGNVFEMDGIVGNQTNIYSADISHVHERNMYMRRRSVDLGAQNYALGFGTYPIVFNNCVVDGGTGGSARTCEAIFTNCLFTHFRSGTSSQPTYELYQNTTDQVGYKGGGNVATESLWDGTITAAHKAALGPGRIGMSDFIAG